MICIFKTFLLILHTAAAQQPGLGNNPVYFESFWPRPELDGRLGTRQAYTPPLAGLSLTAGNSPERQVINLITYASTYYIVIVNYQKYCSNRRTLIGSRGCHPMPNSGCCACARVSSDLGFIMSRKSGGFM
ncbi:Protein of unknown function [Pyronema omphalodes CBS 100304]|uniref:Secreted protein n=1 Tax=Pyronema omphalodes (strain CBS 100304) TaxID=1076935 RepID=U4LI74_PYROM|nr:Protein of unknown function [Pyronema omphalodes CBS 100304]